MSSSAFSSVRDRIERAENLPTLLVVANQIANMVNSPTTSAADIGRVIESDQALTANVLKLVNSAYYSFPQRIRNIQHAVVILGFSKVKNVVLTASVIDTTRHADTGQLDLRRLWQHAIGTAIAAKVVADSVGAKAQADDAFIAGLLHDIGKFTLAVVAPREYAPVLASARDRLLLHAENDLLGFNHAQAGQWLASRWRMPAHIQTAIQYHHRPQAARDHRTLAATVHLGDIVTRAIGVGSGGDNRIPPFAEDIIEHYRVTPALLDQTIKRTLDDIDRARDFFALLDAPPAP